MDFVKAGTAIISGFFGLFIGAIFGVMTWFGDLPIGLALLLGKRVAYSLSDPVHAVATGVVMGMIAGFCALRVSYDFFRNQITSTTHQFAIGGGFFISSALSGGLLLRHIAHTAIGLGGGGVVGFFILGLGWAVFFGGNSDEEEED